MSQVKVLWTGAIPDLSGYGSATREYIRSLLRVGVEVFLDVKSFEPWRSPHLDQRLSDKDLFSLSTKKTDAHFQVIHLTPDHFNNRKASKLNKRIGVFAWETDLLPSRWIKCINESGMIELWVTSDYVKQACTKSGIKIPTYVVPHAILPMKEPYIPSCEIEGLKSDHYNFYTIFQFSERKNPTGILKAYLNEFSKNDLVTLIIKSYRLSDDKGEKNLLREEINTIRNSIKTDNAPRILLIDSLLSADEVFDIHHYADCCVCMARSEGFGLTVFEGMSFGNPVITPNYSAFVEFLNNDISYLVDTPKEIHVDNMSHISNLYTKDMKWGDPDVDSCRRAMRDVFENRELARQKGLAGKEYVKNNLSHEVVGSIMKDRLETLLHG